MSVTLPQIEQWPHPAPSLAAIEGRRSVSSRGTAATVRGFLRFFTLTTGRVRFARRREPAMAACAYCAPAHLLPARACARALGLSRRCAARLQAHARSQHRAGGGR